MLQVRIVRETAEFQELRSSWNDLLCPTNPYSIYLSHEWFSTWRQAYAPQGPLYVLVVEEQGALFGALPLYQAETSDRGVPIRQLRMMANGHSPYTNMVSRPGDEVQVWDCISKHLQRQALAWDSVMLPELPANSRLAQFVEHSGGASCGMQLLRQSPFIPLQGSWDDYKRTLSKGFLKVLRHNKNRLLKKGPCVIECFESRDEVMQHFDEMITIGENSWQGKAGSAIGSNSENLTFYKSIAQAFASTQQVRLWFLKLGGRRVAFELHLRNAGIEFGLKTGYDLELEKLAVGTYLDQHIVYQLFEDASLREYDLLGNLDFYKRRWTRHHRDYMRLWLYGGRWRARFLALCNLQLIPILKAQDQRLSWNQGPYSLGIAR